MRRPLALGLLLLVTAASAQPTAPWPEVNVANANVVLARLELKLYWAGPAFELRRTYNSRLRALGPLGPGWRLTFSRSLKAGGGAAAIEEDDGAVTRYERTSGKDTGPARFAPGCCTAAHTLERLASGAWRRVREGTTEEFDAQGKLARVVDGNGLAIQIAWARGAPAAFTDSTGRAIRFTADEGRVTGLTDPLGRTVALAYDGAGRLSRVTDVLSGVTTYAYDVGGRLTKVTYPGGEDARMTYDPATDRVKSLELPGGRELAYAFAPDPKEKGRHVATVTDEAGRTTVHAVAKGGTAVDVTGPSGEVTRQEACTACGGLVTVRNARGGRIVHEHATDGLTFTETGATGGVFRIQYEAKNRRMIARTDRTGAQATFAYDERGNLVRSTDAAGGTATSVRDARGFVTALVRANGAKVAIEANPLGLPTTITDAMGGVTKLEYDAAGRPVKLTDADGRAATIAYNAADQATIVADSTGQRREVKYEQSGRMTSEIDSTGHRTQYFHDKAGRLERVQRAPGREFRFAHDAAGNVTQVVRAELAGQTETLAVHTLRYDASGRVVSLTDPARATVNVSYSAGGDAVTVSDPLGRVTTAAFDLAGRPTARTDPAGRTFKFAYDGEGRLTTLDLPGGQSALGVYDPLGRLVTLKEPGSRASSYTYSALGRVETATDATAQKATFGFDGDGRVSQAHDPVLGKITYAYTPAGRLREIQAANGRWIKIAHDDAQRTRTIETSGGQTLETRMDRDGRRIEERAPNYHVRWSYTEDGYLRDVTDVPSGRVNRYLHDARGNRTRWTEPDGRFTDYRWDVAGRLVTIEASERMGSTMKFTYDDAGQRVTRELDSGVVTRYTHDAAGRLTKIAHAFREAPLGTYALAYDVSGAVTRLDDDGRAKTFAPDAAGRLARPKPPAGLKQDAAGSVSSEPATTGPTDRATAYEYDAFVRLSSASLAQGGEVKLSYAPDLRWAGYAGPRGARELVYETDSLIAERDAAGQVVAEYLPGPGVDEPALMRREGKTYALLTDHLGSVRKIVDGAGAVVRSSTWTLHGALESETGAMPCAFGFAGRPFEPHTGLVNLRLRWLNPRLARYQTLDPVVLTSRFDYADGNPVTWTDPLGAALDAWLTGNAFGSAAGLAQVGGGAALFASAGGPALERFADLAAGPTAAPDLARALVEAAAGRPMPTTTLAWRSEQIASRAPGTAPSMGAIARAIRKSAATPDRQATDRTLVSAATSALSRGITIGAGRLIAHKIVGTIVRDGPLAAELAPGIPEVLDTAMRELALEHITPPTGPERSACDHTR